MPKREGFIVRALVFILATVLVSGCTHVNYLRDAQSAFNEASAAENQVRYDMSTTPAISAAAEGKSATFSEGVLSASTGYATVLATIQSLEDDSEATERLESDQLYGHALVLKALALWRLERNDEAVQASRDAIATGDLAPRDVALMSAMPGLVKNDQVFAYLERVGEFTCTQSNPNGSIVCNEDFRGNVVIPLGEAICVTNAARTSVSPGHPVRKYLALSTLAAIRNAATACEKTQGLGPLEQANCNNLIVHECVGGPAQRIALYQELLGEICSEYLHSTPDSVLAKFVQNLGLNPDQIKEACPAEPRLGNTS
jgi:hypothetical protein